MNKVLVSRGLLLVGKVDVFVSGLDHIQSTHQRKHFYQCES